MNKIPQTRCLKAVLMSRLEFHLCRTALKGILRVFAAHKESMRAMLLSRAREISALLCAILLTSCTENSFEPKKDALKTTREAAVLSENQINSGTERVAIKFRPSLTAGRVELLNSENIRTSCPGFFIQPQLFITNGECVPARLKSEILEHQKLVATMQMRMREGEYEKLLQKKISCRSQLEFKLKTPEGTQTFHCENLVSYQSSNYGPAFAIYSTADVSPQRQQIRTEPLVDGETLIALLKDERGTTVLKTCTYRTQTLFSSWPENQNQNGVLEGCALKSGESGAVVIDLFAQTVGVGLSLENFKFHRLTDSEERFSGARNQLGLQKLKLNWASFEGKLLNPNLALLMHWSCGDKSLPMRDTRLACPVKPKKTCEAHLPNLVSAAESIKRLDLPSEFAYHAQINLPTSSALITPRCITNQGIQSLKVTTEDHKKIFFRSDYKVVLKTGYDSNLKVRPIEFDFLIDSIQKEATGFVWLPTTAAQDTLYHAKLNLFSSDLFARKFDFLNVTFDLVLPLCFADQSHRVDIANENGVVSEKVWLQDRDNQLKLADPRCLKRP